MDDCISREWLLSKAIYVELANGNKGYVIEKGYVEDAPSVTPTERTGHWIPVSERLPEEEGLYLVSVKNDHDRRYSKTCWFHGKSNNWFARQDVLAWMPLPKPYEPQESEEV